MRPPLPNDRALGEAPELLRAGRFQQVARAEFDGGIQADCVDVAGDDQEGHGGESPSRLARDIEAAAVGERDVHHDPCRVDVGEKEAGLSDAPSNRHRSVRLKNATIRARDQVLVLDKKEARQERSPHPARSGDAKNTIKNHALATLVCASSQARGTDIALVTDGLGSAREHVALIQRRRLLRQVGRRVAGLRAERGLTQEELATRLRMSDRYLRRIEAGEINVSLWSLAKIANALRAPLGTLIDG